MVVLLALAAASLWGTSDFLGGTFARRLHPLAVAGVGQALVLPVLVVIVFALGAGSDPGGWLPWAVIAGLVSPLALAAFFEALATGTMGVVAPVASTGAIVPVAIGLVQGQWPSAVQLGGVVLAIVGVVLASAPETNWRHRQAGNARGRRSVILALIAALGFGLLLWSLARGSQISVGLTLLTSRACLAGLVLLVGLLSRKTGGVRRGDLLPLAAMSTIDVAGTGLYAVASHTAIVAVVAVVGSLYPVGTVLLARTIHKERLRGGQKVGVSLALLGVLLIAAG